MDDRETGDPTVVSVGSPYPDLLGRLIRGAVVAPRGRFRATADYVTVEGPPSSMLPRRFSPFIQDGPARTGRNLDECTLGLGDADHWHVTTARGGDYRRHGDTLTITFPGHGAHDMDVENVRAPNADWPYYAGHWVEELVLPHRFLGLLDDLVVVADEPDRPRMRGRVNLRQPEAYQGIAGEEVLEVEFTADLVHGEIVEAVATTWDHRVETYVLEVLET